MTEFIAIPHDLTKDEKHTTMLKILVDNGLDTPKKIDNAIPKMKSCLDEKLQDIIKSNKNLEDATKRLSEIR